MGEDASPFGLSVSTTRDGKAREKRAFRLSDFPRSALRSPVSEVACQLVCRANKVSVVTGSLRRIGRPDLLRIDG